MHKRTLLGSIGENLNQSDIPVVKKKMKIIIILFIIFLSCLSSLAQSAPIYKIRVTEQKTTHVEAVFPLASNKISMYMRGGTKELPEGEVEFVKNLTVKNSK